MLYNMSVPSGAVAQWESASLAWKRSWVRLPSAPPIVLYRLSWGASRQSGRSWVRLPSAPPTFALRLFEAFMNIKVAFLALILIVLCSIGPAFSQNAAPAGMPDVLLFVDTRNPSKNAVSITYPKVVTRAQAEADLSRLLQETGWSAASVSITEGSILKSGEFPMTSVEFMTPAATTDGVIPIEPIIKAFRNAKDIQVQYLMSADFYFRGWGNFENKWVKITLNRGNNAYRYSIHVKDSGFKNLGLPTLGTQADPGNTTVPGRSGNTLITVVLIVMLALMAATLAYIFTSRYTHRGDYRGRVRRS